MYNLIYTHDLPKIGSTDKVLEGVFYEYNAMRPPDFTGHSLSVSDIIAIKQDGVVSCHYCDRMGFVEIPDFLRDNPLKNAEMSVEDDYNMVDGVINNGEKQSTVAELEQQAKSGQPISLMDLADAIHREKQDAPAKTEDIKSKRMSIYEQLRQPVPQQAKKTAPKKSAEMEI